MQKVWIEILLFFHRVVLDPQSMDVTHLVVRQGLLFSEDKDVPIDLVKSTTKDRVVLTSTSNTLPDFPPFEESYYVPLDDDRAPYPTGYVRPYVGYPPLGASWWRYSGYMGYAAYPHTMEPSARHVEQNIPEHTIGLKEGASVITADDEQVGDVSRVYVDEQSNRATHIVVSRGWLIKEKRLLPTSWISQLDEREVHLGIRKAHFERLKRLEE